jgi:RNA polymerase sigma-70 factor (ECF subfamily)
MADASPIVWALGRERGEPADDVLTVFVRAHSSFVYRVAYFVLRNVEDSQDVVQETFVRVMKNLHQLPLVHDERAWVGQIAWRLALNRRKKLRRISQAEVSGAELDQLTDSYVKPHGDMTSILEKLIASLPEELRNPLVLSAIDEMSSGEVAKILGIPGSTVRTRAHRARKILREKMEAILGQNYEK